MGVSKFLSVFTRFVGKQNISLLNLPPNISSLFFDLASIVHQAAQRIWAYGDDATPEMINAARKQSYDFLEDEFHKLVINLITIIIQRAHPSDLVYIALDGTVPAAKMAQQRGRRFMASANRSKDSIFDSNSITAGTNFMARLSDKIEAWLEEAINTRVLPARVIFSSPREPGEGEQKLLEVLRAGQIVTDTETIVIDPKKTHVIHGLDTDLLMLTLLLPQEKIFLWREQEAATTGITPEEEAEELEEKAEKEEEKGGGKEGNRGANQGKPEQKDQWFPPILSIAKIRQVLVEKMNGGLTNENFVLIMFLLGNDFVSGSQCLQDFFTSIPRLIDLYNKLNLSLVTEKRRINWKNMLKFLKLVAEDEPRLLLKLSKVPMKNPPLEFKSSIKGDVLDYNKFSTLYYEKVMANEKTAGKQMGSGPEAMEQLKNDMVNKYLEVINFCFIYYTRGTERINKDFFYNFHYAPLFREILTLGIKNIESVNDAALWTAKAAPDDNPFLHPYQMLVAVLPLASANLYPSAMLKQVQQKIATQKLWASKFPRGKPLRDVNGFMAPHAAPVLIPFLGPSLAREIKVPKKFADLSIAVGDKIYIKENVVEEVKVVDPWDKYLF